MTSPLFIPTNSTVLGSTGWIVASDDSAPSKASARVARKRYRDFIQVCDGVNDAEQIQEVIDALIAVGGGDLVFSRGTLTINTQLETDSRVHWKGAGIGITTFQMASTFPAYTGSGTERPNLIAFKGAVTTNGVESEISQKDDVILSDFSVKGVAAKDKGRELIRLTSEGATEHTNISLYRIHVEDSVGQGIHVKNTQHVKVIDCIGVDCGTTSAYHNFYLSDCVDFELAGCRSVASFTHGYQVNLCNQGSVHHNYFRSDKPSATASRGLRLAGCADVDAHHNYLDCESTTRTGILVFTESGTKCSRIRITDSTIVNPVISGVDIADDSLLVWGDVSRVTVIEPNTVADGISVGSGNATVRRRNNVVIVSSTNHLFENWGNDAAVTPDANGNDTIAHGLVAAPSYVSVHLAGDNVNGVDVQSVDATNITIRIKDASGADVTSGTFTVYWEARI